MYTYLCRQKHICEHLVRKGLVHFQDNLQGSSFYRVPLIGSSTFSRPLTKPTHPPKPTGGTYIDIQTYRYIYVHI